MPDHTPGEFVRAAEIRLALAASMYERVAELAFGDRYIEMANVAMLVWSAGIDLISVHMLLDGETNLGTSASRRRFLRNRIVPVNRRLQLWAGWKGISRLHGFQHNLDLSETAFAANCRESARLFAGLNSLLPDPLRVPLDAYAWLDEVG